MVKVQVEEGKFRTTQTARYYASVLHDWLLASFPEAATIEVSELATYKLAVPVVIVCHLIFLGLFAYFCSQITNQMVSEKFLAPYDTVLPGTKCEPVLSPWQATFNLDIHGEWSSSPNFQSNFSVYELVFGGVLLSDEDYRVEMANMLADFRAMGNATAQYDIPYAIAVLASYRYYSQPFRFQFYPSVDVRKIFKRLPRHGMIANSLGDICLSSENEGGFPTVSIDTQAGTLSLYYEDYDNFAPCSDLFDVTFLFSSDFFLSTPKFKLSLDVASLQLATAINFGIIKDPTRAGLTQVFAGRFADLGVFYVDDFYPDMQPIFCLHRGMGNGVSGGACFLYFGTFADFAGTFMYPLSGAWNDGNKCPDISATYGMDLLVGAVMFEDRDTTFEFGLLAQENITRHGLSAWIGTVNHVLIEAGWTAMSHNDSNYAAALHNFCVKYCSLVVHEVFWDYEFPYVNRHYVLYNQFLFDHPNRQQFLDPLDSPITCQNVVFDEFLLEKVASRPPQSLQENYKVCSLTEQEALQRAVGISVGNAQLYGAIVTVIFIFALAFTLNRCNRGNYEKKIKSKLEKQGLRDAISKCVTLSMLEALQDSGAMKEEQVRRLSQLLSYQHQPNTGRFRRKFVELGIPEAYLDFPQQIAEDCIEFTEKNRHLSHEDLGSKEESVSLDGDLEESP